jgi:hypothetical protein
MLRRRPVDLVVKPSERYRGVPRPKRYQVEPDKDLTEALAWKAGVDAALRTMGLISFDDQS